MMHNKPKAFLWVFIFAACASFAHAANDGKYVHTVLQANWKSTPIPLEISYVHSCGVGLALLLTLRCREFIATEDSGLFWTYVDQLGASLDGVSSDEGNHR